MPVEPPPGGFVPVEPPPEGAFDLLTFLTNPITIVSFSIMIGALAGVIIKFRKKFYKSSKKEIKRIEEIRRKTK